MMLEWSNYQLPKTMILSSELAYKSLISQMDHPEAAKEMKSKLYWRCHTLFLGVIKTVITAQESVYSPNAE